MEEYEVEVQWSGYCRGYTTYKVMAESEEDAINSAKYGCNIVSSEENVVRDDRDYNDWEVN
jgi:hypothetical protein